MSEPVLCCVHKTPMIKRPDHKMTREQKWCGEWWDCTDESCHSSTLFMSAELIAANEALLRPQQPTLGI
jgi:hypothetical protein